MDTAVSRRSLLKAGTIALSAVAAGVSEAINDTAAPQNKSLVFFTKDISVKGLRNIYSRINKGITGKTGIKLHSGEPHGPNLLPVDLIKGLQAHIPNSAIVECNVLYPGPRHATQSHRDTLKVNGFDFCPVDIMDADGHVTLPVPGMDEFFDAWSDFRLTQRPFTPGWHLREVAVGKNLLNYDSLLVYTHFKGHAMGGFGGSLKNIAIGCASGQVGKRQVHGDGWPGGPLFQEHMVEAGKAITAHFGPRIAYLNVLKNISVDCDCDPHGQKPTCRDVGIVGSTDILAVDKASVDLVYALPEAERRDMVERIQSRSGLRQLEYMKTLHMGNDRYELVTL